MPATDAAEHDAEAAVFAISLGIDMTDEFMADENGQRVVAAGAFGRGRLNFPGVVEIPESRREPAIIDQRIEGGDQTGMRVFALRFWMLGWRIKQGQIGREAVKRTAALDGDGLHEIFDRAEFIAFERGETTLAELERGKPAGRFAGGGLGRSERRGGQHALGKIVVTALVDTPGDEHAAVEKKFLERGFDQ